MHVLSLNFEAGLLKSTDIKLILLFQFYLSEKIFGKDVTKKIGKNIDT